MRGGADRASAQRVSPTHFALTRANPCSETGLLWRKNGFRRDTLYCSFKARERVARGQSVVAPLSHPPAGSRPGRAGGAALPETDACSARSLAMRSFERASRAKWSSRVRRRVPPAETGVAPDSRGVSPHFAPCVRLSGFPTPRESFALLNAPGGGGGRQPQARPHRAMRGPAGKGTGDRGRAPASD
jgi:hypothetical protein